MRPKLDNMDDVYSAGVQVDRVFCCVKHNRCIGYFANEKYIPLPVGNYVCDFCNPEEDE